MIFIYCFHENNLLIVVYSVSGSRHLTCNLLVLDSNPSIYQSVLRSYLPRKICVMSQWDSVVDYGLTQGKFQAPYWVRIVCWWFRYTTRQAKNTNIVSKEFWYPISSRVKVTISFILLGLSTSNSLELKKNQNPQ